MTTSRASVLFLLLLTPANKLSHCNPLKIQNAQHEGESIPSSPAKDCCWSDWYNVTSTTYAWTTTEEYTEKTTESPTSSAFEETTTKYGWDRTTVLTSDAPRSSMSTQDYPSSTEDPDNVCNQLWEPIHPCICYYDPIKASSQNKTAAPAGYVLDCGDVVSTSELLSIPGIHSGQSLPFAKIVVWDNGGLETLPGGAFGLHYATKAYSFRGNAKLAAISATIFYNANFHDVVEINVSDNPALESFPFEALKELPYLQDLRLVNNPGIRLIPPYAFQGLRTNYIGPRLTISMQNHYLTSIGDYAFSDLPVDTDLDLSYAKDASGGITELGRNSLHFEEKLGLLNLREIGLKFFRRYFTSIPPGRLPWTILFDYNEIEVVEQYVWEEILQDALDKNERTEISFAGNPVVCDCHILWLYNRAEFKRFFSSLPCSDKNGQPYLWDLDESAFAHCR